ncbi:hypothetical protein CYMTET_25706 [Cymbomonas tetramitiformis]|uniref:Uncharacterized protein n=1 Tax=Cymbomonas tetramitiformis TaxID=36881 RepID=A0AAE0KYX2_9CHLO|nr:hypothetical protein CYMTET_25706 [Cymbomonas tetramitiformis]
MRSVPRVDVDVTQESGGVVALFGGAAVTISHSHAVNTSTGVRVHNGPESHRARHLLGSASILGSPGSLQATANSGVKDRCASLAYAKDTAPISLTSWAIDAPVSFAACGIRALGDMLELRALRCDVTCTGVLHGWTASFWWGAR